MLVSLWNVIVQLMCDTQQVFDKSIICLKNVTISYPSGLKTLTRSNMNRQKFMEIVRTQLIPYLPREHFINI